MKKSGLVITTLLSISFLSSCFDLKLFKPDPITQPGIHIVHDEFYGYEDIRGIERQKSGTSKITIYGINDFHGQTESVENQIGLPTLATFVKTYVNTENTIFVDSGDAFQGSLESNTNHGQLITECYNIAGLTCMTLGNHDFDWGLNTTRELVDKAKYPVLCANVFDYNSQTKENGNIHQDDLGFDYMIKEMDNGLKIGIIGTIGEDQITSICANLVEEICFKPQVKYIKDISDYLRTKRGCDLIISSSHSYYYQLSNVVNELTSISSVSNKRYIDLMLNGHAHTKQKYEFNDVCFVQTSSNGENIEKIELTYDFDSNKLDDGLTNVSYIYNDDPILLSSFDQDILDTIERYYENCPELSWTPLNQNMSGTFHQDNELPNLMAKAIYKECEKQKIDIDMAVVNYARSDFSNEEITYSNLYDCFPFDNQVHIIETSGYDAVGTIVSNFKYKEKNIARSSTRKYKIAILDYLAFHVDENRKYDNFTTLTKLGVLEKDHQPYIYRDVLKDYLLDNQSQDFVASDYAKTLTNFSF